MKIPVKVPSQVQPRGAVDEIDERGFICGWAFERKGEAAVVSAKYQGREFARIVADMYRHDLEAAGIGLGTMLFELRCLALRRNLIRRYWRFASKMERH